MGTCNLTDTQRRGGGGFSALREYRAITQGTVEDARGAEYVVMGIVCDGCDEWIVW